MHDPVAIFNAVEAAWWISLAVIVLVVRMQPDVAALRWPLSAVLILFGASDVVEIWSGAWWRPWWLAVWKIACGLALAGLAVVWYRCRSVQKSGLRLCEPKSNQLPSPEFDHRIRKLLQHSVIHRDASQVFQ